MKRKPMQHYEARATVAKALGHPRRLLSLEAIAERDMCVCELTELVQSDQSTVSKHLAVLKHAGIVDMRRDGVKTFYGMKIHCLQGFWKCVESVLKQNLKDYRTALGA